MSVRKSWRWSVALLIVAVASGAVARRWFSNSDASKPQAPGFVAGPSVPPGEDEPVEVIHHEGKGEWLIVQGDEFLPNGVALELADGFIVRVSAAPGPDVSRLVGTRYVVDDLDATDITPQLWRSLKLEMPKPDGSTAKLGISRPLWWIEQTGAKVGATIDLGMREIGISGLATVQSIAPCTRDSRDVPAGADAVTGTIQHENAIVWDLLFENDDREEPLGVTSSHPLYSEDRNEWVPAGGLAINERVRTLKGPARLVRKSQRPGRHTVYNIEVHRSHVFYVSKSASPDSAFFLAHNSNILDCTKAAVYRGGNSMHLRDIDVAIDKATGLVLPKKGISLDTVASNVKQFGGAYRVKSIPDELQIIQRGVRQTHFEIVPKQAMTLDRFKELLQQVVLELEVPG